MCCWPLLSSSKSAAARFWDPRLDTEKMSDLEDLEGRARPVVEEDWCWEISEDRWDVKAREEEDWGFVDWGCFWGGLP